MRQGLTRALKQLDAGDHADAIVLTGSGERAFCAGQDLEESAAITTDRLADWLNRQHAMYQAVRDVSKPVVAAINGTAAGAGFQMSLMCDLRVAHAGVKMGQPEVRAGLASIVGSYLMSLQIGHSLNQQLSLTGELLTARRAMRWAWSTTSCRSRRCWPGAGPRARSPPCRAPPCAPPAQRTAQAGRLRGGLQRRHPLPAGVLRHRRTRVMQEFLARRQRKDTP